jgi:hypothetical protein
VVHSIAANRTEGRALLMWHLLKYRDSSDVSKTFDLRRGPRNQILSQHSAGLGPGRGAKRNALVWNSESVNFGLGMFSTGAQVYFDRTSHQLRRVTLVIATQSCYEVYNAEYFAPEIARGKRPRKVVRRTERKECLLSVQHAS